MVDPLQLAAGDLKHAVTIEAPSTVRDAAGQRSQVWTPILNSRASITAISQREQAQDNQVISQISHIIKIRFPGHGVRVAAGQRVRSKMGTFNVEAVDNVLGRDRVLKMQCVVIDAVSTGDVYTPPSGDTIVSQYRTLTVDDVPQLPASKIIGLGDDLTTKFASLDSAGHIPMAQLPAAIQSSIYFAGLWNASTNTPTLTSGQGYLGQMYKVSVDGPSLVDGNNEWHVGDWVVFDGAIWNKIDNFENVTSVCGRTGNVTLQTADIPTQLPANIGIGTVATTAPLSISGTSTVTTPGLVNISDASADTGQSHAALKITTYGASPFAFYNGATQLFVFGFPGSNGIDFNNMNGNMRFYAKGNSGTVTFRSWVNFGDGATGGGFTALGDGYVMGKLGVGTASPSSLLDVNGALAATASNNYGSGAINLTGNYWTGAASAADKWSIQNVLGASGANPTSTLTVTHTGSTGVASVALPNPCKIGATNGVNIDAAGSMNFLGTGKYLVRANSWAFAYDAMPQIGMYFDYTQFSIVFRNYNSTESFKVDVGNTPGNCIALGTMTARDYKASTLPAIYLTNAAAIAGGLAVGAFYRSGADPDHLCIVH